MGRRFGIAARSERALSFSGNCLFPDSVGSRMKVRNFSEAPADNRP